jgi:3-hydroxybutyryl-CoA dehydrogenase
MNPVPVMKLVEIINGKSTTTAVTDSIVALTTAIGKIPCVVKDAPGFIANRILMPMINEAVLAFEEGISDAATIDQIMKLGMAHPMGPLQLADYIGLDVCKNILEIMEDGFQNSKYKPAALLSKMVAEGKLGVKSGAGFYEYNK